LTELVDKTVSQLRGKALDKMQRQSEFETEAYLAVRNHSVNAYSQAGWPVSDFFSG
jgi:hypothetical protein